MVLGEGGILIKCDISSSMLEVVGEVWKGILLCKLYRIVKGLVECGWWYLSTVVVNS